MTFSLFNSAINGYLIEDYSDEDNAYAQVYWQLRSLWPTSRQALQNINGIPCSIASC